MRIFLQQEFGPACTSLGDGIRLRELLLTPLRNGETVEIDFAGVNSLYTPFLNGSLGGLFNFFDKETILTRLAPRNIAPEHLQKFNEFIDRSDRLDTDKIDRETMEDLFEEDGLGDFEGP
ncbi:MAG: hypothetical protein COV67_03775 [Nitrospinae bacterium CG11_big_fil_rev_8_21_14_0_20_56_8]|nr:MAG: hypothetical protein COV67_03775 [Nitrospinae bacterium CG11_big_fil_rev_8_21_14_0_20_56_8]